MNADELKTNRDFLEVFNYHGVLTKKYMYLFKPSGVITSRGYSPTGNLRYPASNNFLADEVNFLRAAVLGEEVDGRSSSVREDKNSIYVPYTLWRTSWREAKDRLEKYVHPCSR